MVRAIAIVCGATLSCFHHSNQAVLAATPSDDRPNELWVDASAQSGGVGSSARPLKKLPSHVPPKHTVHVRSGLYRGPIQLGEGSSVVGHGVVVIALEQSGTVVSLANGSLKNLSVQGGDEGISAQGDVHLDNIHFSGHRKTALRIEDGTAEIKGIDVNATIAGSNGIALVRSTIHLIDATFQGALFRAVDLRESKGTISQLKATGCRTGISSINSHIDVSSSVFEGGTGPAIFVAQGEATLHHIDITGHEYGVSVSRGARVSIDGFSSKSAQQAAISVLESSGTIAHATINNAGAMGAIALLASAVSIDRVQIHQSAALGLFVRHGNVDVHDLSVDGVRGEAGPNGESSQGDAVHVRDAKARIDGLIVKNADGSGLFAGAASNVQLGRLDIDAPKHGAMVAERSSTISANNVTITSLRGPALVAIDGGSISVKHLSIAGEADPQLWADCATSSAIDIGSMNPRPKELSSRCISVGKINR